MADILIRGMEMPESCDKCRLFNECWCMALGIEDWRKSYNKPPEGERLPDCPLVPLPDGHGRLIDADALVSKYTEEINKLEEWAKIHEKEGRLDMFRACHLRAAYLAEAKLNIDAAPTIVPAEGGNADGN